MNIQNIIAAVIILGAFVYIANILLKKTRSFSTKSVCANDCGCGPKSGKVESIN